MTDDLTVALVDDHPALLEGLRQIVTGVPDMHLVGLAKTSAEIVDVAARSQPDVIVLDIGRPDFSGLSAIVQILTAAPATRILILSSFDREDYVLSAIRAGPRIPGEDRPCCGDRPGYRRRRRRTDDLRRRHR